MFKALLLSVWYDLSDVKLAGARRPGFLPPLLWVLWE